MLNHFDELLKEMEAAGGMAAKLAGIFKDIPEEKRIEATDDLLGWSLELQAEAYRDNKPLEIQ